MQPHMTTRLSAASHAVWQAYITDIACLLGLTLHEIALSDDAPSEECGPPDSESAIIAASTSVSYTSLTAVVYLSDHFFGLPAARQRRIIVHEVLHVLDARRKAVTTAIESSGALGSREWSLYSMELAYAEENEIDHLAHVIAPYLPLPTCEDTDCSV